MMLQRDIEQRLTRSADALARAVRKLLDKWLREGVPMEEILRRLSAFRLPPGEARKLEESVKRIMQENARARTAVELGESDITRVVAASQISVGNIQQQMKADLQREVRRAIAAGYGPAVLQRRLEERELGRAQTEALTAVSRFNNLLTFENAAASGTEYFTYFGPVSAGTRPFCRAHAGQIFSLDEIERMDNGQGLSVRESCGGYNCRHHWIAAGGQKSEVGGQKSAVRIGKQTFLMNDEQARTLFTRERQLWIQTPEASRGKNAAWHLAAKPLAAAHDGFNERITNSPADGVWVQRIRKVKIDGKVKHLSNFDFHARERKADNVIESRDDYRRAMTTVMRDGSSVVYESRTGDRSLRYLVHNETSNWLVMLDRHGAVHSAYPRTQESALWRGRQRIGLLKDFLGDFK